MSDNWLWLSAADLGRGIGAGGIDPRELTEAYLAAIEAHPAADDIYARTTADRARAEADAAAGRARDGLRRGPLDGVPISWKDGFDTAGVATEAGTRLLAGRVPERDAANLTAATRAGLVCLGKTHMTELAFSGLGINPRTATPPNINDPEVAPGGSSSGAATSVAFGLAAAGIGSDTGGSIRVPAGWNDLVGFKPGHGVLSGDGIVALCPRFDTPGPITRTVEDAALIFAAMGGDTVDLTGASLAGMRMLVLDTTAIGETREAPAAAFEEAVERLAQAGVDIVRGAVDAVGSALDMAPVIFSPEAYASWRDEIEANPDAMFPPILARFRSGGAFSAPDYVAAWQKLDRLRAEWAAAIAGYDAVLVPTIATLPPNVERALADHDYFTSENLLTLRNTRIGNMLGGPSITLPTGTESCGLMAMGLPGSEARVLRVGAAVEAVLGE